MSEERSIAFCEVQECDWTEITENEEESKVLMVCHFVVKHPERYQLVTGRDPELSARRYAEHIERYKERI